MQDPADRQNSGTAPGKALLIDLDGTLVHSLPDLAAALNRLLAELDHAPLEETQVRGMIGDGVAKLVERGLAARGTAVSDGELNALMPRFVELYESALTALTRPYPGVPETLRDLTAEGWSLAVCTNKPEAASRRILDDLGLMASIEAVAGGDTYAVRKPDPGHLLNTLARLEVPAERAVMLGDGRNDVLAAHAAGLPAILVSFGYSKVPVRELGADAVIDDFAALPAALAQLGR